MFLIKSASRTITEILRGGEQKGLKEMESISHRKPFYYLPV